jgi:hypothetical protein
VQGGTHPPHLTPCDLPSAGVATTTRPSAADARAAPQGGDAPAQVREKRLQWTQRVRECHTTVCTRVSLSAAHCTCQQLTHR